jgi:hypothetical protein
MCAYACQGDAGSLWLMTPGMRSSPAGVIGLLTPVVGGETAVVTMDRKKITLLVLVAIMAFALMGTLSIHPTRFPCRLR